MLPVLSCFLVWLPIIQDEHPLDFILKDIAKEVTLIFLINSQNAQANSFDYHFFVLLFALHGLMPN